MNSGTGIKTGVSYDFDWDDWLVHFVDDKFSLWWAPIYIVDNIFTRLIYLVSGGSELYFMCGVFEGYHVTPDD